MQAQAEQETAHWAVNVRSGESLDLTVQGGPEAPAAAGTVELRDPSGLVQATAALGVPISLPGAAAGLWTVSVRNADGHYVIAKPTGGDQGIYVTWMTWGYAGLSGTVTRAGQPNATPVTVEIVDQRTGAVAQTLTGVTGGYAAAKLPVGGYTVRVIPPGGLLAPAPATVTLTCDGAAVVNFDLPNRPPTVTLAPAGPVDEGGPPVTLTATASDPDGDPLTFSWSLTGPGALTPGDATAAYRNDDGPAAATITVTVADTWGAAASDSQTVLTLNLPPVISDVTNNGPINEGSSAVITVTASDPAGAADPLRYAFDCDNDGAFETGPQTGAAAACAFADNGAFVVKVWVSDDDGGVADGATTVIVNNVAPVATFSVAAPVNEGSAFGLSLANPSDPSPADTAAGFVYAFDCGDGAGYSPFGASAAAACPTDDNGARAVRGQIRDKDGGVTEYTATAAIANVAPTADAGADQTQFWGLPVRFTGAAADPSSADTAAGLNLTWSFGDGPATANDDRVTHTYADPGVYTVTLTATDKDGGAGSDTAQAAIAKRGTALTATDAATAVFGFPAQLSAQLRDIVDAPTARLDGRTVIFTVNGTAIAATANASGAAAAAAPALLPPGSYPVSIGFAGDGHYLASTAQTTLTVLNSAGGKVTGGVLRTVDGGRGGFNVQAGAGGVRGELEFQAGALNFHAATLTALGVSPDGKQAWFAGVGRNGQAFIAYVEDNGEPGRNDVFKIWIGGALYNGDGALSGGNIQIHK